MPKKTLALIAGLVLVTIILFIIALKTGQGQPQTSTEKALATPTASPKNTSIKLSPNPAEVVSGRAGSVDVSITPEGDLITGFQLELLYDPTMVRDVKVSATKLFANAIVFTNKNDQTTGTYSYWFALQPGQKAVKESGVVATITFTAMGVLGKQSQIFIQPTSMITAQGVTTSVMKEATGATVVIVPVGTTPTTSVQGAKIKITPASQRGEPSPTKPVLPKKTTTPVPPPSS